jgi:YVTN family beta-propeller protein
MKPTHLRSVVAYLLFAFACLIPGSTREARAAAPPVGLPAVPAVVAKIATGVGTQPTGVAFDSFHQTMWVALSLTNVVNEYSLTSPYTLLNSVSVNNPYALVFDPGNYTLWVTGSSGNVVSVVDTNTATVVAILPTGAHPAANCFDGSDMWVPNFVGNSLSQYVANPPASVTVLATPGSNPHSCVFDGTNLWLTLEQTGLPSGLVEQLNVATGATATFGVGAYPWGIAFDGTNLWVANQNSNNVMELNTAGAVLNTIPVGPGPRGVVYGIGAGVPYIWVINNNNNGSGTLTQIQALTATVTGTSAALGTAPQFGAFDPINNHIWLADSLSNQVKILK